MTVASILMKFLGTVSPARTANIAIPGVPHKKPGPEDFPEMTKHLGAWLLALSLGLLHPNTAPADQRLMLYSATASPAVQQAAEKISALSTPRVDYAQLARNGEVFVRIAPRRVVLSDAGDLIATAILGTKPYVFVTTPESVYGKPLLDIYLDIGYEAEDVIRWQRDEDMVAIVFRFPATVTVSDTRDGRLPEVWNAHVYVPTWDNIFVLFDHLAAKAGIEPDKKGEFAPHSTFFRSTAERDFVQNFPAAARARVKTTPYIKMQALQGDDWRYRELLEKKLSVFEHFRGNGRTLNEIVDPSGTQMEAGLLEFVGPNHKLADLKDMAIVHLGKLGVGDSYFPASPPQWVAASGGRVPAGALVAGAEKAPCTEPLYLCRAKYGEGMHPGKLRTAFGGCSIPWGGREVRVEDYEVLVR